MNIALRIEERRKAVGIKSQAELARRVGIAQSTMNGLANRAYRWSPHLPRIARELRTSVDYLVGDTDDPDANVPPPPPPPAFNVATMTVLLPDTRSLTAMFEGLLDGIDPELARDEQALLLAERLPTALSQLVDAQPGRRRAPRRPAPASVDASPATRDREPQL